MTSLKACSSLRWSRGPSIRVLVAEDNPFYLHALRAMLSEWGYEIEAAPDGAAAWDILQRRGAPQLAILDWEMPGMDGIEVCRRLRALQKPEPTYVIILTSRTGTENLVAALENGADDFASKPFEPAELRARLQVGTRIVGLQASETAVFIFARAVEAKSPYTHGHSDRVTRYALALADRVGVSGRERELLRRGGLLHDVGKICVPDDILNKPGKLTDREYEIIKQHPAQGQAIVEPLQSLAEVLPLIRWHHERPDGRGYPDGLAGNEIPYLVRILSVADVYDALASARPYRPALPCPCASRSCKARPARAGSTPTWSAVSVIPFARRPSPPPWRPANGPAKKATHPAAVDLHPCRHAAVPGLEAEAPRLHPLVAQLSVHSRGAGGPHCPQRDALWQRIPGQFLHPGRSADLVERPTRPRGGQPRRGHESHQRQLRRCLVQ
jgi:putative two-component system response regulator